MSDLRALPIVTLPLQPGAVRPRAWRSLEALGCAAAEALRFRLQPGFVSFGRPG